MFRPKTMNRSRGALPAVLVSLAMLCGCSSTTDGPSGTPAAAGIGVASGNAQSAVVGTTLASPLMVRVTDQFGNSFPGAQVTFVGSSNVSLGSATTTTDANGNAQTTITFNTHAGPDTVTASVVGATTPATFLVQALPGPVNTFAITGGNGQSGVAGTVLGSMLAVQATDTYGNILVGDTVTWAANAGTLGALFSLTDSTGTAQMTFTPTVATDSVTATPHNSALSAIFTETGN